MCSNGPLRPFPRSTYPHIFISGSFDLLPFVLIPWIYCGTWCFSLFTSVSPAACVSKSTFQHVFTRHTVTWHTVSLKAISCMHALCSKFTIMHCRKILWAMINGYLPLALEIKKKREGSALAVKRTVDLVYPKWFSLTEFRGFGTKVSGSSTEFLLTQPWKKIAHCSMITPLTFSQTVTKTTSRGHTSLQGKICILRYCFLWKYMGDL